MARTTTRKPLPDYVFYPLWKATFDCQLRVLHNNLAKTEGDEGVSFTEATQDDFDDFCQYVYQQCPELVDEHQN